MLSPKRQSLIKYFSKSGPTEGQGDVSNDGLGFVLMQLGQPVTLEEEHSHWQKGTTHRLKRNCWLRSLVWNTTTTMHTVGSLDRSRTIGLHFNEAPGINSQETGALTVAASTV